MLFCSKQKHMQIEKKSLHFRISLRRVQLCIHQVTITIHYVHHSYSLYGPLFVYPFWGSSQYMGKKHNCSASNKAKIIQTKNSKNVLVSEASDIGTLMEIPEAKKKFEIKICWITVVFFERSSPWTKVCAVKKKKCKKSVKAASNDVKILWMTQCEEKLILITWHLTGGKNVEQP